MSTVGARVVRSTAFSAGFFSGSSKSLFTHGQLSSATASRQLQTIWRSGLRQNAQTRQPTLFFRQNRSISSSSRPFARRSWFSIRNSPLFRRLQSTKPPAPGNAPVAGPVEKPSLSQRLRKLSREYGWSAVGVYLALSLLDLPVCFLIVRGVGVDRIGHWEEKVVHYLWSYIPWSSPNAEDKVKQGIEDAGEQVGARDKDGWAIKKDIQGEKKNGEGASLWTQFVLAYAIHKSVFIFFRVPATAAITPKVVKTLRGWGWNIGKRTPSVK